MVAFALQWQKPHSPKHQKYLPFGYFLEKFADFQSNPWHSDLCPFEERECLTHLFITW